MLRLVSAGVVSLCQSNYREVAMTQTYSLVTVSYIIIDHEVLVLAIPNF